MAAAVLSAVTAAPQPAGLASAEERAHRPLADRAGLIVPASAHPCLPLETRPVAVTGPDEQGFFRELPTAGSQHAGQRFLLADTAIRASTAGIAQAVQGQPLWAWAADKPNRWGLVPAWIAATAPERPKDRDLLQIRLIERGFAMAAPYLGSMACSRALLEAEQQARMGGKGVWEHDAALSAGNLKALTEAAGTYVLVEGRIVSLGKTSRTRYLNFGRNWKTDFTATLSTKQDKSFSDALARAGTSLEDLAGKAVQIRGAIDLRDGPHISMTHPGQLIVLDGNEEWK